MKPGIYYNPETLEMFSVDAYYTDNHLIPVTYLSVFGEHTDWVIITWLKSFNFTYLGPI